MKIHDLYLTIEAVIEEIPDTKPDLKNANGFSIMSALYSNYAVKRLLAVLRSLMAGNTDKILTSDDVRLLETEFSANHGIVSKSPLVAPHNPQSKLSIAFLTLAQHLESTSGKSRYQFLFPSVNVVEYEASSMSLHDNELQLTDFILSDDETAVIEVLACLDFSIADGVLKHTRLFDGQMRALSSAEADRVINHSTEARLYWQTIQEKLAIELHGSNAKAALNRLVNHLDRGGEHGGRGGAERNAGADANVGIHDFFVWFDTLHDNEKESIRKMTAPGHSHSLGNLFDRLASPTAVDLNDVRYCVELIGGSIARIIETHPELSDLPPKDHRLNPNSIMLEQAQIACKTARHSLALAMGSRQYKVTSSYHSNMEIDFINRVACISSLDEYLGDDISQHFQSSNDLISCLRQIEPSNTYGFLLRILPRAHSMHVATWDFDLKQIILSVNGDNEQMAITHILAGHICKIANTLFDLKNIVESYKPQNRTALIKILIDTNPTQFLHDTTKMAYILQHVDILYFDELKDDIINNYLIYFLQDENGFFKRLFKKSDAIDALPIDKTRIDALTRCAQQKIILAYNNIDSFVTILNSLPESRWDDVFNILRHAQGFQFDDHHLLSICLKLTTPPGRKQFSRMATSRVKDKETFRKAVENSMPPHLKISRALFRSEPVSLPSEMDCKQSSPHMSRKQGSVRYR